MGRYLIRRVIQMVFVLLVISAITYAIFFLMSPIDPAVLFAGKVPQPQVVAAIRKEFGLNKPIYMQYLLFVKHIFLGDQWGWPGLGFSFQYRSAIRSLLAQKLVISTQLAVGAAIIWLVVGIPVGIVSALRRRTLVDRTSMGLALFFVSVPEFWLGLMFLYLFWYKLGIASGTGYVAFSVSPASWFNHMLMPWIVLALGYAAWYSRMTRAGLIQTMHEDYIRTARAKGVSERRIIYKHALRSCLTPVVTMFGMDLGALIGGAVIVEVVFNLPGIGQWAVSSAYDADLPAILAITLVTTFAITIANLFVDIAYVYLDPRVRYA
jgi:peptide/nickel transport system permease protein